MPTIASYETVTPEDADKVVGTDATDGTTKNFLFSDIRSDIMGYETGTWTPAFALGSGSVTYTSQVGTYTKIGRMVTVCGSITLSGATTPGGSLAISGLPFSIGTGDSFKSSPCITFDNLTGTNVENMLGECQSGSPTSMLIYVGGGTTLANTAGANLTASTNCRFFMTYFT